MDKKGEEMTRRRCFALAMLVILVGIIAGCETCKGAAEGFQKDWATLKRADRWVQQNLW